MKKKDIKFEFKPATTKAIKVYDTKGADSRDQSRFHVNMIFGTQHVTIVDTKYKPLVRSMKIDVDQVICESSFREIFEEVVEALHMSGNLANDEAVACITFPEGSIQVDVPMPGDVY